MRIYVTATAEITSLKLKRMLFFLEVYMFLWGLKMNVISVQFDAKEMLNFSYPPSPHEDALLSHRLDVASDDLACLQLVYRQNFGVLHWLGLLWVQPGRAELRSAACCDKTRVL